MEDAERKSKNVVVKKSHPRERANCLSGLFFCWLVPTYIKGLKKDLQDEDVHGPLKQHSAKALGDRIKKAWDREVRLHSRPSLTKVIMKVYWGEMLYYSCFLWVQDTVVKMVQPLLVGKLLDYYALNQTIITKDDAYLFAAGIVLTSFLNVMTLHYSFFGLEQLALKMQVASRSLIYRKALKLNKNAMLESTLGQMVNLISNDVSRFHYICLHLHQVIVAPIQTIVVLYLLFATVDTAAMVGVGLLVLSIPFLMYMGKLTARFRFKTAVKTDNRIRLMNEIISGIKVIKMYTWEKPFAKLVEIARRLELHEIKANAYVRSLYMSTSSFLIPASIFLCVLTYVITGNTLQAKFVYVVTTFYGHLRLTLTLHVPRCVAMLAEINVSIKRIQKFLLNEEVEDKESDVKEDTVGITMEKANVKWSESSTDNNLTNVDFRVGPQQLVAIVGRVGSGKSTLIQTFLKEVSLQDGELNVNGTISYASQEPWLFSSSIRQNILFGQEMDLAKYKKVVQVCALDQDFSVFPYGDRTIVGEKGIMLSGGQKARVSLARAIYRDADIYLLDDPLSAVDVKVGKQIFDNCITGYLKNKCTILVTHQIQYLSNVDKIYVLENGTVTSIGTYNELKQTEGDFSKFLREVEEEQLTTESEADPKKLSKSISLTEKEEKTELPKEDKEQRGVGHVSKKVYGHYFRMGGSYLYPALVFITFVLSQISTSGVDYFLTFWVNLEQKKLEEQLKYNDTNYEGAFEESFFTSNNLLYMYAALVAFMIFMVILRSICFVQFSMKVAQNLHNFMFERTVRATMRFFNTNSSGRILNRFARDMGIVDESLPMSMSDTVQVLLNVIAITVIISSVNPWIILPTIIIFVVFYAYKHVFLSSSRDLKRIEGTARSPMFSHLTASLQGLSTIRAFNAQKMLEVEFDHIQDHHSSAFYMFTSCSRSFGFWLDLNCVVYIGIVIFSFLFIGTETYGGNVGLAITQSIALTGTLQRGIRQWSELENQMTSVERIVEYTELSPEPDQGKKEPPKSWPEQGNIEFNNVSLKYSEEDPHVLKQMTYSVAAKEKIGIVGRTGAGKSSLISALFRLAPVEGTIKLDSVDTKEIPLNRLRSIMSIIPQEPVLFSGPLRENLDPFDEYSDEELWNALQEVELKEMISELPAGLSTKMSEGGSNFSIGERQLLCLARAVVRKTNILILDEATANVDLQTDELIQKTIRRKFKNCTVLTIAHRLNTIMDADKILVLDAGRVVEFDHPYRLLENTYGLFYSLVQETGPVMADTLTRMALENFQRSRLHG